MCTKETLSRQLFNLGKMVSPITCTEREKETQQWSLKKLNETYDVREVCEAPWVELCAAETLAEKGP